MDQPDFTPSATADAEHWIESPNQSAADCTIEAVTPPVTQQVNQSAANAEPAQQVLVTTVDGTPPPVAPAVNASITAPSAPPALPVAPAAPVVSIAIQTGNGSGSDGGSSVKMALRFTNPPAYFGEVLADAELLLKYASESGVPVEEATREHVLHARAVGVAGWNEQVVSDLLAALATLTVLIKPVSAASLRACSEQTGQSMNSYTLAAIILALVIVPFSVASFLASSISASVKTDVDTANALALKLQEQLGYQAPTAVEPTRPCAPFSPTAPADLPSGLNRNDIVSELQQYASTIRSIDARAAQLDVLLLNAQRSSDPCGWLRHNPTTTHAVFQLPSNMNNLAQIATDRTTLYQDVRYFAQNLLDDISFFYGAISTCILPVLYALLGTCAYLLRDYEQRMGGRTFVPSRANSARFVLAGIGGAVVGMFNNVFITQSASVPPLAIAFMVGYAVDVFFAFLEGLVKSFTHDPPSSTMSKSSSASK